MENKLQKIYPTDYSYRLLIVQNLWQALYHILSIIFLKEFIKLNVNTDMKIKNAKIVELNLSIVTFLEYTNFKDDLIECKCLCCNKIHTNFQTTKIIILFLYYEKMCIVMNIWMIGKNLMKPGT